MKGSRYLYIFEDNSIGQAGDPPTDTDLVSVADGVLVVIRLNPETGTFEDLGQDGEWHPTEEATIRREGGETFHFVG